METSLRNAGEPEFRVGDGRLSGALGVGLGSLSLLAVLSFRFPELLTTPEFRAVYPMGAVRAALFAAIDTEVDPATRLKLMQVTGRGCFNRHKFKQDIAEAGKGIRICTETAPDPQWVRIRGKAKQPWFHEVGSVNVSLISLWVGPIPLAVQDGTISDVAELARVRFMIHLFRKSFTGIEMAVWGFLVAGSFPAIWSA